MVWNVHSKIITNNILPTKMFTTLQAAVLQVTLRAREMAATSFLTVLLYSSAAAAAATIKGSGWKGETSGLLCGVSLHCAAGLRRKIKRRKHLQVERTRENRCAVAGRAFIRLSLLWNLYFPWDCTECVLSISARWWISNLSFPLVFFVKLSSPNLEREIWICIPI